MFVITELSDSMEIRAASVDKKVAVIEQIQNKYINKLVSDLGLAVHLYKVIDIPEYEIHGEILVASVRFQLILY